MPNEENCTLKKQISHALSELSTTNNTFLIPIIELCKIKSSCNAKNPIINFPTNSLHYAQINALLPGPAGNGMCEILQKFRERPLVISSDNNYIDKNPAAFFLCNGPSKLSDANIPFLGAMEFKPEKIFSPAHSNTIQQAQLLKARSPSQLMPFAGSLVLNTTQQSHHAVDMLPIPSAVEPYPTNTNIPQTPFVGSLKIVPQTPFIGSLTPMHIALDYLQTMPKNNNRNTDMARMLLPKNHNTKTNEKNIESPVQISPRMSYNVEFPFNFNAETNYQQYDIRFIRDFFPLPTYISVERRISPHENKVVVTTHQIFHISSHIPFEMQEQQGINVDYNIPLNQDTKINGEEIDREYRYLTIGHNFTYNNWSKIAHMLKDHDAITEAPSSLPSSLTHDAFFFKNKFFAELNNSSSSSSSSRLPQNSLTNALVIKLDHPSNPSSSSSPGPSLIPTPPSNDDNNFRMEKEDLEEDMEDV